MTSPLPWTVAVEDKRGLKRYYVMSGGVYVASCHLAAGDVDPDGGVSSKDNAERIVHRANTYDALVDLLSLVVRTMGDCEMDRLNGRESASFDALLSIAPDIRKALRLAESTPARDLVKGGRS